MKVTGIESRTVRESVVRHVVCDKCNGIIEDPSGFDYFDFELVISKGERFPESEDIETKDMDLCSKCSDELVTLLESNGFKFNNTQT